jgi:hypothetical protein
MIAQSRGVWALRGLRHDLEAVKKLVSGHRLDDIVPQIGSWVVQFLA